MLLWRFDVSPCPLWLPGPFEVDFLITPYSPLAILEILEFLAGDWAYYPSSFFSPSLSNLVLDPKLLLVVYFVDVVVDDLSFGKYFLIQETWTFMCLTEKSRSRKKTGSFIILKYTIKFQNTTECSFINYWESRTLSPFFSRALINSL